MGHFQRIYIHTSKYFTLRMFISTPHTNCEPHFPKNWEILATSHVITAQTSLAPTWYLSKILHDQIFGPTKHGGKLFFYCKKRLHILKFTHLGNTFTLQAISITTDENHKKIKNRDFGSTSLHTKNAYIGTIFIHNEPAQMHQYK